MDTTDQPRPTELARLAVPGPAARPRPPFGESRPSAEVPNLNPRVVLRGLRRYWWQILLAWAVGSVGLAALIHQRVEPDYEAFSLLRVDPSSRDLLNTSLYSDDLTGYIQTQVRLVTSRNVLSAVLVRPEVSDLAAVREAVDAEEELRDLIQVEIIPGTQLIRISAALASPTAAATIVNTVVEAFQEADSEWSASMTRRQIDHMKGYREKLETKVKEREEALLALAAKGNLDATLLRDPAPSALGTATARDMVTIDEYTDLRQQLHATEVQLAAAESLMESLQAVPGAQARAVPGALQQALQSDPEIRATWREVESARDQLDRVGRLARKPSDPAARNARERLAALEAAYRELWTTKQALFGTAEGPSAPGVDPSAREAQREIAMLRASRATLEERLAQVDVANKEMGTDAVRATFVQADLQLYRGMLQSIESRLEQLELDAQGLGRITLISAARPPIGPLKDRRLKYSVLASTGLLGLLGLLGIALEVRARRVTGPDDLASRILAQVFAVPPLPVVRPGRGPAGRRDAEPIELFVQRLDHLRVALCGEAAAGGSGRCVLITSAAGGEGKTTLAAQLAVRCAEAGVTTLLIDADLRRASLGRLFEVPECPGLSDVLRGDVAVEDALVPVGQVGGCQLLPAGSPEDNPSRVLQGRRIRAAAGAAPRRLRRDPDRHPAGAAGARRAGAGAVGRRRRDGRPARPQPLPADRAGRPAPGQRRRPAAGRRHQRRPADGGPLRDLCLPIRVHPPARRPDGLAAASAGDVSTNDPRPGASPTQPAGTESARSGRRARPDDPGGDLR